MDTQTDERLAKESRRADRLQSSLERLRYRVLVMYGLLAVMLLAFVALAGSMSQDYERLLAYENKCGSLEAVEFIDEDY